MNFGVPQGIEPEKTMAPSKVLNWRSGCCSVVKRMDAGPKERSIALCSNIKDIGDRVSLCGPDWPATHRKPTASAS